MARVEQLQPKNESSTGEIITFLLPFATIVIANLASGGNPDIAIPIMGGGTVLTVVSAAATYLHNVFSGPHSN